MRCSRMLNATPRYVHEFRRFQRVSVAFCQASGGYVAAGNPGAYDPHPRRR